MRRSVAKNSVMVTKTQFLNINMLNIILVVSINVVNKSTRLICYLQAELDLKAL